MCAHLGGQVPLHANGRNRIGHGFTFQLAVLTEGLVDVLVTEHVFDEVAHDWRVSPRVLGVDTESTVLEHDQVERLVEPSARA